MTLETVMKLRGKEISAQEQRIELKQKLDKLRQEVAENEKNGVYERDQWGRPVVKGSTELRFLE